MKQARADVCISMDLLRYVRDQRPNEFELLEWLGPSNSGCFYVLKKEGVIVNIDGHVVLSPQYLSEDASTFFYGNRLWWLDRNRIDTIRLANNDIK